MTGIVNAFWDGDHVAVVERDESGHVQVRRQLAEHSCFIRSADLTRGLLKQLRDSGFVTRLKSEGEFTRICWVDRSALYRGCMWFAEELKIQSFEGGVNPVRRWMVDNSIWPAPARSTFLDLETDSDLSFAEKEKMRIFCVGLQDAATGKQKLIPLEDDSDAAEKLLLEELREYLQAFDRIDAWNGERFDFPVLKARIKRLGMWSFHAEFKRWLLRDHMVIFKRMNLQVAESGDEKESFALEAVAHSLGLDVDAKTVVDASKTRKYYDGGATERSKLFKRCLHDVWLEGEIERETGYLALNAAICELMGVFADSKGARPAGQVESYMLRVGLERGHRFPTKLKSAEDEEEREQFRGAHVMAPPPKAGILSDVHVLDFSSLYPSVMISFNTSPETVRDRPEVVDPNRGRPAYLPRIPFDPEPPKRPEEFCEAPITNQWFDTREQGLLPYVVQRLLDGRKYWSDMKASLPPGTPEWHHADRMSNGYKVSANACFGVAGNEHSIIFDVRVAESIAQGGVWLIKLTLDEARKRGWRPIYGDTDSAFIAGPTDDEIRAFRNWCNEELYPPLLAARGCRDNRISIAYEKKYRRLVFTSPKRYCASWAHYKGKPATSDSKPEIKGLEYKRGDSARLARKMQWEFIKMLVVDDVDAVERYVELVERWREHLMKDELEQRDIVLSKSVNKSLKEYAQRAKKDGTVSDGSAHVAIARKLEKRGFDVGIGTRIEYVVTDASVSPMEAVPLIDFDGSFDRHYLWENLTWPASKRLLENAFPGHEWDRFDRTRPPKPRGKGAARNLNPEGQTDLLGLLATVRRA